MTEFELSLQANTFFCVLLNGNFNSLSLNMSYVLNKLYAVIMRCLCVSRKARFWPTEQIVLPS